MKKIVAASATVFMLFMCTASVSAANVELALSSDEAYVNKSFDVNVTSDCADFVSGGMFTLSYESNVVEFKDIESKGFDVEYKNCEDTVKVVFVLNDSLCEDDKLLDLKFKAKSEAQTDMRLVSSEIVDRDLNVAQSFCSCNVSVNKKDSNKNSATSDEVSAEEIQKNSASDDSYSVKDKSSDKSQKALYIASGAGAVVAISINAWLLIKSRGSM